MVVPVKGRRECRRQIRDTHILRPDDEPIEAESVIPCFQEKLLGSSVGARTKTDTGRRVENTKAIERTMVKELGIMVP